MEKRSKGAKIYRHKLKEAKNASGLQARDCLLYKGLIKWRQGTRESK